jgi:hypothetical protein
LFYHSILSRLKVRNVTKIIITGKFFELHCRLQHMPFTGTSYFIALAEKYSSC